MKVNHDNKESEVIGLYCGRKDSKKNVISSYIDNCDSLNGKKYTLDALHNSHSLLEKIASKGGKYLVQIKSNQKELLEDLYCKTKVSNSTANHTTLEKGHGRIDNRHYELYNIKGNDVHRKWSTTGLATLVKVTRKRNQLKTGKTSTEISYYISNQVAAIKEFTSAIRNHWCVEVNNRIRDVNFGEDHLKSFKNNLQRTVSSVLTMVLNLLYKSEIKGNFNQIREILFMDKNKACSALASIL